MAKKIEKLTRAENALWPGSGACPGCGSALLVSYLADILKKTGKNIVFTIPASCWTINTGRYPHSFGHEKCTFYLSLFASAVPDAAAFADYLKLRKRNDTVVVAFCGDGSTTDIGFATVSAAATRNDNILYILNDNEAYMNTGVQKSGSTPYGAITTTTPKQNPNKFGKKDMALIMAAHHIPYLATAALGSVNLIDDFYGKIEKAVSREGFKFIHVLTACPPGWKSASDDSMKLAELAVNTNIFPIVECENGKWKITHSPSKKADVTEYLKLQGRFSQLTEEEIQKIRSGANERYEYFKKLSQN